MGDSNKRVIVIGASSRLGGATCKELAKRGAKVAGTFHLGEDRFAQLSATLPEPLLARRLDVTDAGAIDRVIAALSAELGGADALVHCPTIASASARGDTYDRLDDVEHAAFARMLAVNVTSALMTARAFARATSGARNLVFVGSIDGAKPVPSAAPYAASKGAVVAMARALAKELGPSGILVNVAAPGVLEGGITDLVPDEVKREYKKHTADKRFGTHEEIARTIAWLCLSNTYVTGQTLVLDGGL